MDAMIIGTIGPWQLVVVVLVLVLLFGSAKIPELMRNLGKGVNEFKKSTKGAKDEADKSSAEASKEKEEN